MKGRWIGTLIALIVGVGIVAALRYQQNFVECQWVRKVDYHHGNDFQPESEIRATEA